MSEQVTTKKQPQPQTIAGGWPVDAVAYLQGKSWQPCGDPRYPGTTWLDPTQPERDIEEYEDTAQITMPNREVKTIRQLRITPRAFPMSLDEAVTTQLARDKAGR